MREGNQETHTASGPLPLPPRRLCAEESQGAQFYAALDRPTDAELAQKAFDMLTDRSMIDALQRRRRSLGEVSLGNRGARGKLSSRLRAALNGRGFSR